MQQFIQMAAQQLGTPSDVTSKATHGLLSGLREKAGAGSFDSALSAVPGLSDFLEPKEESGGAGGMLGGLIGQRDAGGLGGMLGGLAGQKDAGGLGGMLSGGGLGGLAAAAGGMLGGDSGNLGALIGMVSGSGLDAGKIMPLATMLISYLKKEAGDGAVSGLLGKVPELARMLG